MPNCVSQSGTARFLCLGEFAQQYGPEVAKNEKVIFYFTKKLIFIFLPSLRFGGGVVRQAAGPLPPSPLEIYVKAFSPFPTSLKLWRILRAWTKDIMMTRKPRWGTKWGIPFDGCVRRRNIELYCSGLLFYLGVIWYFTTDLWFIDEGLHTMGG